MMMHTKILKTFISIGIGLALLCGTLFAFDGGFTRDNDVGVSNAFFAMNPTNGEIIDALYGDGTGGSDTTYYTKTRTGNACNVGSMGVVLLSPGTNTIPELLSGNTIYVLNSGNYTINSGTNPKIVLTGNCIGVVGSGDVTISRSATNDLFRSSGMNNLIFANMTIDGVSQSYGGILLNINDGINNSFTDLLMKQSHRGIFISRGGHTYAHNIKARSFARYPYRLLSSNFNILDHFEFSSNMFGGIYSVYSQNSVFQNGIVYNTTYPYIYTRPCGESALIFGGSSANNETLHNVQSFNNRTCGIYNQSESTLNLNNLLLYNNSRQGIRSREAGSTYTVHNTHVYNNDADGSFTDIIAGNDIFNDTLIYNNKGYGITSWRFTNRYFGTHTSFDNLSGDFFNTVPGSGDDPRVVDIGLTTGALVTGFTMDCSRAAVPLGLNLGASCATRSSNMGFVPGYANTTLFTFGSNIRKQVRPIMRNAGSTGLMYSTGIYYDSGLYVGQYVRGGLSGVQHIYSANPINLTTTITLRHGNAVGTGTYSVRGHGLKHAYSGVMSNSGMLPVDITDGYGNKAIFVQYKVENTYSDIYSTYIPVMPPQTDAILNNISIYSGTSLLGHDIVLSLEYRSTEDASSGYVDFYNSTGLSINLTDNPGWSSLGGNVYRYFLGDFSGSVSWSYLYLTATVLSSLPEGFTFETTGYIDNAFVDTDSGNNQYSFSFPLYNTTDLAITGTMNKIGGYVLTGDDVTYTIHVTNNGPHSAADATLQVLLDTGLSYLTSTPGYTDIIKNGTGTFVVTGDACYDDFLVHATGAYLDAINAYIIMNRGQPSLYNALVTRYGFTGTTDEAPAYLKYLCTDPGQRGYTNMRSCIRNQFGIDFNDSAFASCGAPFIYLSGNYYEEFLDETGVYWSGFTAYVSTNRGFSSVYDMLVAWFSFTGVQNESAEYFGSLCSSRGFPILSDCLENGRGHNIDLYFGYTTPLIALGYIRNLGTLSPGYSGNIIFHALVLSGANPTLTSPVIITSSSYDNVTGNNRFNFINYIGTVSTLSGGGGGGGGGDHLTPDNCPDGDYSPSYYDHICGQKPTATHAAATTGFDPRITRKALAKMVVPFAENILKLEPKTGKQCFFSDIKNETTGDQAIIKTACQLEVMGMRKDGISLLIRFKPNAYVTRNQFIAVISRLLYNGKNNVALTSPIIRYTNHDKALQRAQLLASIPVRITASVVINIFKRIQENPDLIQR